MAPVAIVCIGMAGSGKTTFVQRINAHLHEKKQPPYVVNLDPAVHHVPFESNIDIRDSVNYKEVMSQYNLGPNGGILTSLNLFTTKIDQIVDILEKRTAPPPPDAQKKQIEHVLVDTPGQIEVFVWSASGEIILGSLASSFPTVIAYVIDTPRASATSTFMSNMLYACSILYKTKLPMILVFNKTDVQDAAFAKEWMDDFEAFQAALRAEEERGGAASSGGPGANQGSGYLGSLLHSMSLVLDEFYQHLSVVGVSSMTGHGVDEFFAAVDAKVDEFDKHYRPELERRRKEREAEKEKLKQGEMSRLLADMNISQGKKKPKRPEPETVSDMEDEDDEDDEDEDDEDRDGGLEGRYKQAMQESSSQGATQADMSFMKYLHSSNIG
jgi:GPN-loop GTPase